MKESERAAIIKGTGARYRCNNCCEMVTEAEMQSHICNPVHDLVHKRSSSERGLGELAWHRGYQVGRDESAKEIAELRAEIVRLKGVPERSER